MLWIIFDQMILAIEFCLELFPQRGFGTESIRGALVGNNGTVL
jgi:hypothetical protein